MQIEPLERRQLFAFVPISIDGDTVVITGTNKKDTLTLNVAFGDRFNLFINTTAQQAFDMGLVNTVVPLADLERETVAWCRRMLQLSPLALRMVKASMNAADDGLAGIQQLAGDATLLFYLSEEAQEGRNAYLEKRTPDFSKFPRRP